MTIESEYNDSSEGEAEVTSENESPENVEALKSEANELLRTGNAAEAKELYEKALKAFASKTTESQEASRQLKRSIVSNISLCAMKLNAFREAISRANEVLLEDPSNAKLLHRRAVCYTKVLEYDAAEKDYVRLVALHYEGAEQMLAACRQASQKAEASQRRRFGGLFANNESLYDDRENERVQAEIRLKKEREEYQNAYEKQKSAGTLPDNQTFEEFIQSEKKKKEDELREKQKRERSRSLFHTSSNGGVINTNELELDDEDMKIIEETKQKGYCYFKRELTPEEKLARETTFVPERLTVPHSEKDSVIESVTASSISEWNKAGTTYEEKDTSKWCKAMLESAFNSISEKSCKVESVESIEGEAQLMMVRGTVRHFYEFEVQLNVKFGPQLEQNAVVSLKEFSYNNKENAVQLSLASLRNSHSKNPSCLSSLSVLERSLLNAIDNFETLYASK